MYLPYDHHLIVVLNLCPRARTVRRWEDRELVDIMDSAPDGVYASMAPNVRDLLSQDDLEDLPMFDDEENEIPIYCRNGFNIPRRIPCFSKNVPAHGLLLNLTTVNELFNSTSYDNEGLEWDEDDDHVTTYVYPQAGLKTFGHYQANGIMRPFKRFLAEVNQTLQGDNQSDDGDNVVQQRRAPIVCGIASQGYNGAMHSTRGHSAQHSILSITHG